MTYDATKLPGVDSNLTDSVVAAPTTRLMATQDVSGSQEPISLEEAKDHLHVVFDDENDYISMLITAARQAAEDNLNRTIMQRTLTAVFDSSDVKYVLRRPPIISVDNVFVVAADGTQNVLDASMYRVSPSFRIITAPGATWLNDLREGATLMVDYTAGYAPGEVPAPIIHWMKLVIGTMYANRETMSAGVQIYSMPDNFMSWLMQPYMVYE